MNIKYLVLRVVRHFLPEAMARFLLKRRWIIQPGLESSEPAAAVERYIQTLAAHGWDIQGKRVMLFGYGGRFAVGVELLRRGAAHVVLCDHFVLLDNERNLELLPAYEQYLKLEQNEVQPRSEFITLLHGDIREESIQAQVATVDIVLSISVYEHLDDVDGITSALAKLTSSQGVHLHFVDLRDHYFKLPFEMLKYSETMWRRFLNPTSNLNRFRLRDYQRVYAKYFEKADVDILERKVEEFLVVRSSVRPEFITGDVEVDAVTLISAILEKPKK